LLHPPVARASSSPISRTAILIVPMRLLVVALAIVSSAACRLSAQAPPAGMPADLIVHHAAIHTASAAAPRAEALASRGDRLIYVGSNDGALALRGPNTQVIDAGGRAVIPGLHDAHGHVLALGAQLQELDLRGTRSLAEVTARVAERARTLAPDAWLIGRGWDQNDWPDTRWPTHADLEAAAPGRRVWLSRIDGHAGVASTRALREAGLTAASTDPTGGRIIRDAAGAPAGVLVDRAMDAVTRRMPAPTDADLDATLLAADAEMQRLGLTTVHDAGIDERVAAAYRRLADAGTLRTRVYAMLRLPLARLRPFFTAGPLVDHRERLTIRAIKISADGALGSRGAALLAPYSDEPGTSGFLTTSEADLDAMTRAAAAAGFQTCVHAIGDRANRVVMDTFARVDREVPGARALRNRNEHAQILDAAEIPRFAALGVIASMQPTHATSDMPWVPARIGAARTAAGAYRWQALKRTGARLASGSDFPVEEANPMLGLYAAITRQAAPAPGATEGVPPGGWMPDERLSRDEALRSFTIDAAYAAHQEARSGSLEVGKLADLLLLSRDVMQVPPRDIPTTQVLLTVSGGRITHDARPGAPPPAR
jgi:predicted amidohydrolase YtcJ